MPNRFFDIEGDVSMQLAPWELVKRGLPTDIAYYKLVKPLKFYSDIAGGVLLIDAGFVSDLASIPRMAWSIFMSQNDPRIALGGWFHDMLYQCHGYVILESGVSVRMTRKQCDRILADEAMVDLLATPTQRRLVYQSVRRMGYGWSDDSKWERFF